MVFFMQSDYILDDHRYLLARYGRSEMKKAGFLPYINLSIMGLNLHLVI